MSKVEVVIPVGPGDPQFDTPNTEMLRKGLENVRNSVGDVSLTVAMDRNMPAHKVDLIRRVANKVVEFDTHSYYRPGGIWNKIYTCWEQSDADYVAWNGYDDFSSPSRFERQAKMLDENPAAASCFCMNAEATGPIPVIKMVNDGHINFASHLGRHAPFMGAFLLRRSSILGSGIAAHRLKWSYYFEGLLYAYVLKMGMPVVSAGVFHYHHHEATISNTAREERDWVKAARREVGYTEADCVRDWNSIGFDTLCAEIRKTL
jgi:hypothetical protein